LHYALACAYATRCDGAGAADWLGQAVELGWNYYFDTITDPVLARVREEDEVKRVIGRIEDHVLGMRARFEEEQRLTARSR
jgi:hypothetical protein